MKRPEKKGNMLLEHKFFDYTVLQNPTFFDEIKDIKYPVGICNFCVGVGNITRRIGCKSLCDDASKKFGNSQNL